MITEQEITIQYAVAWLQAELQSRGIPATVQADRAEERRGDVYTFIGIPVLTPDDGQDVYGHIKQLTEIECKWNFQEPPPEKLLSILDPRIPRQVW